MKPAYPEACPSGRPHLTERELIEYEFKLVSDIRAEKTATHLAECRRCREYLEQLKRKFAALGLLREEVKVSDDLVSQVLEQTSRPAQARVISFRKTVWIGAAAAVVVAALLLLSVPNLTKNQMKKREFAKKPTQPVVKYSSELEEQKQIAPAEGLAKDADTKTPAPPLSSFVRQERGKDAGALALKEKEAGKYLESAAIGEAAADVMPQPPPFVPASAIELVVLPRREKVQLTIYNSSPENHRKIEKPPQTLKGLPDEQARSESLTPSIGLTLVRERRNLTLKKGWNWLQFMWANTLIDPTSLSLEPLEQADKIDVQQLVFPPRLRELGRWLIHSQVNGQVPFEITYFTSGLSWRAFYMGTLSQDEKTMSLNAYVRVDNSSGEDYENAQTRLIVGKVHILDQIAELAKRQYPYDRPGIVFRDDKALMDALQKRREEVIFFGIMGRYGVSYEYEEELKRKEIRKEGLSEYFLYTIEGTETIADKWGKRLLSFEADDIKVQSLYKYDQERWGNQTIRFVAFANDKEHNLGQTPIPNGSIKIYSQVDNEGYLSYVGGTDIKYIPVDEEVELNLGPARLVKVEPVLMDYKKDNFVFEWWRGNITGWDEIQTWKLKIVNTRPLPVEIEITRRIDYPYWTLQADIPYEKYDARHVRFKINLEPRSQQTFEYTVRIYHGERKEFWQRIQKS